MWACEAYLVTHGREIILPALPVDPRDLFRGDYAVLRYTISRHKVPAYNKENWEEGRTVYVSLKLHGQDWEIDKIDLEKPVRGLFLLGKTGAASRGKYDVTYEIKYGIESFFVPEGDGKRLEALREKKKWSAVVNVTPDGHAKIKRLVES